MYKKVIINGNETLYSVSDKGEIKNDKSGNLLKISSSGTVQLSIDGKNSTRKVSRIVADAFIPNENGYEYVTHLDGNKSNNTIENLKWISTKENGQNIWAKRRQNGTTGAGVERGKRKRENIVGTENFIMDNENEKQIVLDGELIPYSINTEGKVKNLQTKKYLNGSILHTYRYINFRANGINKSKAVHQLVASAFIPNPNNYTMVDHINGDRLDNHVENLRWVSAKENANNIHLDKTPSKPNYIEPEYTKEELDNEKWIQYGNYQVSNLGRVIGKHNKILKGTYLDCGYIYYDLDHKNYLGHLLVWEVFNGKKPDKMVINHINGNKHDNRLSNLELITHKENMIKASIETNAWGFKEVGEFDDDGNMLRKFPNASEAARAIGILPSSMRNSIRRKGKCFNGLSYRYI